MKLELSQKKYRNLGEALLDFFPKYKDNLFGNSIVLNFTSNIIKIRLEDMSISKHYNCIIVEAENKSTLEKTRQAFYFKDMLKALDLVGKVLFITKEDNENLYMATRNLGYTYALLADEINCYDLVNADYVVMDEAAINYIEEVLK